MIQTIILFVAVLLLCFCFYRIIYDIIIAIYDINKHMSIDEPKWEINATIAAICLTYIIWYCN